jgi:hypothetical protein
MSFVLQDNQKVALSVVGVDERGNPATITGTLAYATEDPNGVLTLTDNGDGTASVAATGTVGSAMVTVANDTDDPDADPNFMGSLAFDVIAGEVTAIQITPGTPEHV